VRTAAARLGWPHHTPCQGGEQCCLRARKVAGASPAVRFSLQRLFCWKAWLGGLPGV